MNPLTSFLKPQSLAVVGASRNRDKVGHQILKNILDSGYEGEIYPVNPSARSILSHRCYPHLSALPDIPDLVLIVTPRDLVPELVAESRDLGVPSVIIVTSGFAESDPHGHQLQAKLDKLRSRATRILGPNCLGIISPTHSLNASFGPKFLQAGKVMLISQSGAMITGVLDWASSKNIGISHAISLGNRMDISENDCLDFAATDPHTEMIMVYLESFADAPQFFAAASRLSPHKPIILIKGGASTAGQKASMSHTAALATDQVLVKAFAKDTGVILADNLASWFGLAEMFYRLDDVSGLDLAIITNAGGPGVLSVDEAQAHGLKITPFTSKTALDITTSLQGVKASNPLDILGDATPEAYSQALKAISRDQIQDSILVLMTPQTTTKPRLAAKLISESALQSPKPIVAVLMGGQKMTQAKKILQDSGILVYDFPTEAIKLLTKKAHYDQTKHTITRFRPPSSQPGKTPLKPENLEDLFDHLAQIGFHLPKFAIAHQLSDIPAVVKQVGQPFFAKTAALDIAHKKDVGGLSGPHMTQVEARFAYRKLRALHSDVLFQKMIHGELEIIIGAKYDPSLGPFMMFGLGGSLTNYLDTREYLIMPTSQRLLSQKLQKSTLYPIMTKLDLKPSPLLDDLLRFQDFFLRFPNLLESEINPLILTKKKNFLVDIKITLR